MGKKTVQILGSGPSLKQYVVKADIPVWTTYTMKSEQMDTLDVQYFGMHHFEVGAEDGIIDQSNYPLEDIIKKFNCSFFTNTVSYMIAKALYDGFEKIIIAGVDMNMEDEYYTQRSSVMYWVAFCRAKNVEVEMYGHHDKPSFLYGYEPQNYFRQKLYTLKNWAETEFQTEEDNDKKHQYIGYIFAIDSILKEV